MKTVKLTTEQIQSCEQGFEQACERGYISENSSRQEIDNNIYEILEFGCDDVDEMFSENSLTAAVDYIYENCCR